MNSSTAAADAVTAKFAVDRDLRDLTLRDGAYNSLVLPGAQLEGVDLRRTNFQEANLSGASLAGVDATRAIFTKANLSGANLNNANLRDAVLNSANLTGADARGCSFTPTTNLRGAIVTGLKIDRRALRMLGASHAGLTDADLAELIVDDDQAKLTMHFGGFWSALHLAALSIFILPYLIFAIRRYVEAAIIPCRPPACRSLREALWHYIATGGSGAKLDWVAITIFALLLLYNVSRAMLVFKAKALVLAESAAGIPQQFVLRRQWWVAYQLCTWLVWVNAGLVLMHAYRFLDTPVHL
jgi:hypothetical protein